MCCYCTVAPGGRYGDSLRTGQHGLRIPLGAIFAGPIQMDVEAYSAFCKMDIGFVSWGPVADYLHLVLSPVSIIVIEPGLVNLWHACEISLARGIHYCTIFLFLLRERPLYCGEYVYAGYIHISECVETVCGLPFFKIILRV
jgi:hypothetical protein